MKDKKTFLFPLLAILIAINFTGCNNIDIYQNTESNYEGQLTIQGVGPEVSFEPTVDEGTLVLRRSFEDHTDHVFLRPGIWESFFKSENEYLPGNTVKFIGQVEGLDAAAGNHYYNVKSIEKLEIIAYPDKNEIKNILTSYNYCEEDSDCTYTIGMCPLGCYIPFNKKFGDIPTKIISNYKDISNNSCTYDCAYTNTIKCENYKCAMSYENESLSGLYYFY